MFERLAKAISGAFGRNPKRPTATPVKRGEDGATLLIATRESHRSLQLSPRFLEMFSSQDFTTADRAAILKALHLLDSHDRHPRLSIREIEGRVSNSDRPLYEASAERSLRITFERLDLGMKQVLGVTKEEQPQRPAPSRGPRRPNDRLTH